MKNKFNSILIHKILLILAIFLLCINMFVVYSFGSEKLLLNVSGKDINFIFPNGCDNEYKYFFIYTYDSFYTIFLSKSELYINGFSGSSLIVDSDTYPFCSTLSVIKGSSCDFNYNGLSKHNSSYVPSSLKSYNQIFYSNHDILDKSTGKIIFEGNKTFQNPSFITSKEQLESGKFDILKIDAGDLDYADDKFVFNIYKGISLENNLYDYSLYKSILLDSSSSYLHAVDLHLQYYIPQEKLGIDLSNGKNYMFELKEKGGDTVYSSVSFTISGLTEGEEIKNSQDVTNDKLDEQTNAIKDQTEATKEQTEVNKNIFEKIGDILSYINPFSENFFVYKLIELLVDAIKSLFIPSDDFFGNYFNELKDWFSDRLGFLFYPFELIIDILNKILSINFSEPIFNVPDISEPFTGSKLISATTFNLSSLLENGIFNTVHEIYFICVDAFITFKLVNLFKRKYEEVTEK